MSAAVASVVNSENLDQAAARQLGAGRCSRST